MSMKISAAESLRACDMRVQRHFPVVARPQIRVSRSQWICKRYV